MLKKLKATAIGVTIFSLFINPAIQGSTGSQTIDALFSDIKIFIDGMQFTPRDAYGEEVEPFIYNGTTYLPLRAIANAFNQPVSWDGETNTIYIGEGSDSTTKIFLDELNEFSFRRYNIPTSQWQEGKFEKWSAKDKTSDGENYLHCVKVSCKGNDEVRLDYLLNQKYSRFTARAMLHDASKNVTDDYSFRIYLDDNASPVYTNRLITGGSVPKDISINVTGAIKITFELRGQSTSKACSYVLTNPILTQ